MTNVKYLKENNLYEAHKHFMRMVEGFGYGTVEEADDDAGNPQDEIPAEDPMGGQADPNGGGEMMPPQGGEMPQGGGEMMPQDDPNGEMPPQEGGMEPPMCGEPMGDETFDDEPESNEEVIDVEDITNAEEKLNDKVNSVGRDIVKIDKRIDQLLGAIEKMETMIDNNNNDISALNQEFQKRNPTETERLNLRSLDSYPFNIKPTDYWREKNMASNYDAYSDNDEPTTDEYKITNNDVDDFNEREIAKSFYVDDNLKQDINKIFGY